MGTWRAGNSDSDTAMDHLYEASQTFVEQTERFLADPALMDDNPHEGDTLGDVAMANVELLCRIAGSTRDPADTIRGACCPRRRPWRCGRPGSLPPGMRASTATARGVTTRTGGER